MAAAQVREGYTDVKYGVRHDITTVTAAPESSSTISPDMSESETKTELPQ